MSDRERPRRESSYEQLDVGSLLTIDVESELRKLTVAQLQGPWQLPAELVRRAIRNGARSVEVEISRGQLRVSSVGGSVPIVVLRELAVLLDRQQPAERRHRALSALEQEGALSLLGLVGLSPSAVRIVSAEAGIALEWRRGAKVELREHPVSAACEVTVRGAKLDRSRAREWLTSVARFAPVSITLDGARLGHGFEDALAVRTVTQPLPGRIGILRSGEVARILLLQDGLVTTHLSVTEAPCFEAAIETTLLAEAGAGASRLRDALAPHVKAIVGAAIEQLIELGRGGSELSAGDRARVTQLLLHAARRRNRAKTIAQLPLFRGIERDGRERFYDLLALRQSVHEEAGERLLPALFPDQDPSDFAAGGRVFVLDDSERAMLAELLELGFRQPQRRAERRPLGRILRDGLSMRGRDLFAAVRPGGRPVADAELDADERVLLDHLRAVLVDSEVAICTGRGPVRRIGPGPDKLLLPREDPRVKAAAAALHRDPGWIYPVMLTLFEGREIPMRARRRWHLDSWRSG